MAWFWTDDLARLVIERDSVAAALVAHWITTPIAHRGDGEALDIARALLVSERDDTGPGAATTSVA